MAVAFLGKPPTVANVKGKTRSFEIGGVQRKLLTLLIARTTDLNMNPKYFE